MMIETHNCQHLIMKRPFLKFLLCEYKACLRINMADLVTFAALEAFYFGELVMSRQ